MNRTRTALSTAAALTLTICALGAGASDAQPTDAAQGVIETSGGHATDATDRGGPPSNGGDAANEFSILVWLTGLMD